MAVAIATGFGMVLASIIVPLAIRLLAALGVGFVTYAGVGLVLDQLLLMVQAQFAFPQFPQVLNLLALMNVDKAITMMMSAITIRATLAGLSATGALRRFGSLPG